MKLRRVWPTMFAAAALHVVIAAQGQAPVAPPAQAAPSTDIYLLPFTDGPQKTVRLGIMSVQGEGIKAGDPVNISNNPGYDNQPEFLPDSSALLFSSNRDGVQTDIYRYDIAAKTTTQVTHTAENEYSPTMTPDGRTFTTVRGAEQRLWRFNADGTDAGLTYAHRGKIGYHAWVSPAEIAAFVLAEENGAPNTLQLIDLATGTPRVLDSRIGRALRIRPKTRALTYVRKPEHESWEIRELDATTGKSTFVVDTLDGSEDFAWTPQDEIVMGSKSLLSFWAPRNEERWIKFADLSKTVTGITRVAVSPDGKWLAVVGADAVRK